MATITGQNISDKAHLLLQDQTNIRWTTDEILGWINSAQREILIYKPNANPTTGNITTVAGTKQNLPTGGIQLLDVVRTVNGNAITCIDRQILDVTIPGWHAASSAAAKHYVFDPRNPTIFYVYPPSPGSVSIEAVYSALPTDLASLSSTIFNDLYETVILDYVLYRAYSKDSEHTANSQRATQHQNAFLSAITGKTRGEVGLAPDAKFAAPGQQPVPQQG